MDPNYYIELAATGLRMPIATHLVLHEAPDPEAVLLDGPRLAAVMAATADRFHTPLALPVMDLTLEKDLLLQTLGSAADGAGFHFDALPAATLAARIRPELDVLASPRLRANCEALGILRAAGRQVPVGMSIGPFSLLTKLVQDPITPIYLAGTEAGQDDEDVALLRGLLGLCETLVQATCAAQIRAGAQAIFLCEPAANRVFFSPNQLREGSRTFDEFVIQPNRRLKDRFDAAGTDLLFHDCGELDPAMIAAFAVLEPRLLSLGSQVNLWEAEPHVRKDVVLFGNLPTRKFYSDEEVPLAGIPALVAGIEARLRPSGHPYIIGSECDVLSVPGRDQTIRAKVQAMCAC